MYSRLDYSRRHIVAWEGAFVRTGYQVGKAVNDLGLTCARISTETYQSQRIALTHMHDMSLAQYDDKGLYRNGIVHAADPQFLRN